MSAVLPADMLLNNTPACANLCVHLVQLPQLPLLPLLPVDVRVDEVYPLLAAFDFRSVEAPLPKLLCDSLPALGSELGVKHGEQFDLLNQRWVYLTGP